MESKPGSSEFPVTQNVHEVFSPFQPRNSLILSSLISQVKKKWRFPDF